MPSLELVTNDSGSDSREYIYSGLRRYFCINCTVCFDSRDDQYHQYVPDSGIEERSIFEDIYLVCTACGTQHLVRRFQHEDTYTSLLVQREPVTLTITPEYRKWHAEQKAKRASANERILQAWCYGGETHPRINLMPPKRRRWTKNDWESLGYMLLFATMFLPGVLWIAASSLWESLPAVQQHQKKKEKKKEEEDKEQWIIKNRKMMQEALRLTQGFDRLIADTISTTFRNTGIVSLPRLQSRDKRLRYVGYNLDHPLPPAEGFHATLHSVSCAECGKTATLTDEIKEGMTCPRCKRDTIEKTSMQDQRMQYVEQHRKRNFS